MSRRRIAWTAAIGHAFRGYLHHGVLFGTGFALFDLFGASVPAWALPNRSSPSCWP